MTVEDMKRVMAGDRLECESEVATRLLNRCSSSPISITDHAKSKKWGAKNYALEAEGRKLTAFQTIVVSQAHGLETPPEKEFWDLSDQPWFPEAFFCFWRLRSQDVIDFVVAYKKMLASTGFPQFFNKNYLVPTDRVSICTTELSLLSPASGGKLSSSSCLILRNHRVTEVFDTDEYQQWRSVFLKVLREGMKGNTTVYLEAAEAIFHLSEYCAKNSLDMFLSRPEPDDIGLKNAYDTEVTNVCIGTNTAQMLNLSSSGAVTAKTRQSLNEVATMLRKRMPRLIRWRLIAKAGCKTPWKHIPVPSHKYCTPRRVQLNLCKVGSIRKCFCTGLLKKPRQGTTCFQRH